MLESRNSQVAAATPAQLPRPGLLEARITSFRYPSAPRPVLRRIAFTAQPGTTSTLLGLSGSGKTTFLSILLGALSEDLDAVVRYHENEALAPSRARAAGLIGVLFQNNTLVPWLDVRRNMLLPSDLNDTLREPSDRELRQALSELNLPQESLDHAPHQLSAGMARRVAIARTLLHKPRYLLLDETFSGLDTANSTDLARRLLDYIDESKATCVLVTHDIDHACLLGTLVYYLTPDGVLESLGERPDRSAIIDRMRADLDCRTEHLPLQDP